MKINGYVSTQHVKSSSMTCTSFENFKINWLDIIKHFKKHIYFSF